jgi:hypothetical protein
MTKKLILQRTRHFFSVEGEGEQSIIKWIQELSDQNGLHVHHPNLEGLLLRLMPGKESLQPDRANVQAMLRNAWPNYKKPADARTLAGKFTLADLLRVAKIDSELSTMLSIIGLNHGQ